MLLDIPFSSSAAFSGGAEPYKAAKSVSVMATVRSWIVQKRTSLTSKH